MTVQTSYDQNPAVGFNGLLAESFSLTQIDSRLAEGDIVLGQAIKRGSSDAQAVPCVADDAVDGIAVFSYGKEKEPDGSFKYADKQQLPMLYKGRYWAEANSAIAYGASVAYDPATGKVGAVVGATTTLAFGVAKSTSGGDGDLIIVELW